MKAYFNFRFDNDLKRKTKDYGDKQEPKESISRVIHKALHELLKTDDQYCTVCGKKCEKNNQFGFPLCDEHRT